MKKIFDIENKNFEDLNILEQSKYLCQYILNYSNKENEEINYKDYMKKYLELELLFDNDKKERAEEVFLKLFNNMKDINTSAIFKKHYEIIQDKYLNLINSLMIYDSLKGVELNEINEVLNTIISNISSLYFSNLIDTDISIKKNEENIKIFFLEENLSFQLKLEDVSSKFSILKNLKTFKIAEKDKKIILDYITNLYNKNDTEIIQNNFSNILALILDKYSFYTFFYEK